MDYIELTIIAGESEEREILVARLAALGFESFTETETGLSAYIPADHYPDDQVRECLPDPGKWTMATIADRNWNAEWERAYDPVVVAGQCRVRAPFHPPDPSFAYDLVIEPRMAFGTAHHETTSLMISLMLEEEIAGQSVLDMGCGTGVLAILAARMGAGSVTAIDNDEWAFSNATDNLAHNAAGQVTVLKGDANHIPDKPFDLIVANINRNILLQDLPAYARHLGKGGRLLLSGFYTADLGAIKSAAEAAGLLFSGFRENNDWVGARFCR